VKNLRIGTAGEYAIRKLTTRHRRQFIRDDQQIELRVLERAADDLGFGCRVGFENQPALAGKDIDNQISYDWLVFDNKNSGPAGSHELALTHLNPTIILSRPYLVPRCPMVCVILIAEDEVMVRNLVRHLLTAEGHEILAAADGSEALELSRKYDGTIDLLITDIKMPRMDGLTLIEKLLKERPNIRILVMSGHSSEALRGREAGFSFLHKPFPPGVFRQKVREVLGDTPCERTHN
jgi:two-component system cell cycle response regulator CpdR